MDEYTASEQGYLRGLEAGYRNGIHDAMQAMRDASLPEPGIIQSPVQYIVDFEICVELPELKATIAEINQNGWSIISITQSSDDAYTVFFRRPADG